MFQIRTLTRLLMSLIVSFIIQCSSGLAAPISDAMHSADARLERRVTISGPSLYLGKLIEDLSTQSGVTLSVSDRDAASGERVAICLKNVSLIDALNSIWSLFSYRGAEWNWIRSGTGTVRDPFVYMIGPTRNVKQWSEKIRRQIQSDYEDEAASLVAGLKMTSEQIGSSALDPTVKMYLADEEIHHGIAAFAELPPDTQNQLLHSGNGVTAVPVTPTSGSAAAMDLQWLINRHNELNPPYAPGKEPSRILFSTDQPSGGVTNSMFVELEGFGGGGVIGGDPFEAKWQRRLEGFWMHEGDLPANELESKLVPATTPALTADETRKQEAELHKLHAAEIVARRIQQAADSKSYSFIERLPWVPSNAGESTPDPPYEKPLSKLFARLNDLHYHHKWRSGILLVSRFSWINADQDAMVLPYSVLQKVWHLRDDPRPSLEDLVFLAAALSPEQIRELIDDNNPSLVTVYANMPILGPLSQVSLAIREQMRQEEGVPCAKLPTALRSALKIDSIYDGAVRVRESESPPADSSDGRIFHYFSFIGLPAADTSGRRPTLRSFIGFQVPEAVLK